MVKLTRAGVKSKVLWELSREFLQVWRGQKVIAKHLDRIVRVLQWPTAYALAALSPLIVVALAIWLTRSTKYPIYAAMFWAGAVLTLTLARSNWVSSKILKTAIRYERRFTQAVLAFLLLQPTSTMLGWVKTKVGIPRKNNSDPSPPSPWLAEDNWLIRTSPYFLPTASIVLWLLSALLLPAFIRSFVLGVGVAYHLLSVYVQLRFPENNQLILNYPKRFLWLFLVPMNLLVFVTGYAFALQGFLGLHQVLSDLTWPASAAWNLLSRTTT